MLLGAVVDFLDFHAAGWHWPAFNLADSAITCGAVLLVWDSLRPQKPQTSAGEAQGVDSYRRGRRLAWHAIGLRHVFAARVYNPSLSR